VSGSNEGKIKEGRERKERRRGGKERKTASLLRGSGPRPVAAACPSSEGRKGRKKGKTGEKRSSYALFLPASDPGERRGGERKGKKRKEKGSGSRIDLITR